jgi:hypothetical protein
MRICLLAAAAIFGTAAACLGAQGLGSAGSVGGTVTDPSGALIAGATVQLQNVNTHFDRSVKTDASGAFRFPNLAPVPYHLTTTAPGFQPHTQDVNVTGPVPVTIPVTLQVATETTTLNVTESAAEVESVPTAHTDLGPSQMEQLPNYSVGNGLNDAIAHSAPGIVQDSNGFIHPQGDHGQTQYVFDNQPVTDQQSKQFSTSMPEDAIASVEVISGAPPAEYGDKTSLVVNAITKSGLGATKPFGSLDLAYGSFGTGTENFTFGNGGQKWGNFISANTARSGRYLDSPEFAPMHDVGNNETIFDRLDFQPNEQNSIHLNLFVSRAWFQTPNTYDQQALGQDQRELIQSWNIAPGWVHIINPNATLTVSPYIRQDQVHYDPSSNPFADQPATASQSRRLTNTGIKTDVAYTNSHNNIKAGVQVQHTFLTESFALGITDPTFVTDSGNPSLAPYDLTNGGHYFDFRDHADIKEYSMYVQDSITFGGLTLQPGLRQDVYRGLVGSQSLQPRIGLSYLYKPTSTVLRLSYSKFFETPYNENLLVSSATGAGGLASNSFGALSDQPLRPGTRDQYNAGIQQGVGKHIIIDAGYFWKYTHNAFDFDTLFDSPIAFPIEWRKSKIDGANARITLTDFKGINAYTILGHTRARFFGPEIGGILFNSPLDTGAFRIDPDQAFEQTTNLRYQPRKNGPWASFTWRYDSGQVAGSVPDITQALALTADEQAAIGFHCGAAFATVAIPITGCPGGNASATRIRIPPPGTENDDTNPARIAARNLFDIALGDDNLFHTERPRYRIQFTAVNVTNVVALYNFLSTFSGTHFVSPRAYTAEIGMVW